MRNFPIPSARLGTTGRTESPGAQARASAETDPAPPAETGKRLPSVDRLLMQLWGARQSPHDWGQ